MGAKRLFCAALAFVVVCALVSEVLSSLLGTTIDVAETTAPRFDSQLPNHQNSAPHSNGLFAAHPKKALHATEEAKLKRGRSATRTRGRSGGNPLVYTYEIVQSYNHDPEAFTQGLLCAGGGVDDSKVPPGGEGCKYFWESTGINGKSGVRLVERESGSVVKQNTADVNSDHFGEGVVRYKDEMLMLTWQTNVGLAFDSETLRWKRDFTTPMTDGWGLTLAPGNKFIGTDSTEYLYTMSLNAEGNLEQTSKKTIHDGKRSVKWLNEIEWIEVDGEAEVSPETGRVLGWVDMSGLTAKTRDIADEHSRDTSQMDVLNGVAWDKGTGKIWVTGKQWPGLHEVKITQVVGESEEQLLEKLRNKCIL